MTDIPVFSVVIPTYNRARHILKTVESVLQQNYNLFELILVDDGSTDDTSDIVKEIKDKRLKYIWTENGERGKARNTGTNAARGRYVTFLDSDDIIYPDHLKSAFEFMVKHHEPEVFHLGYEIKDNDGKVYVQNVFNEPTLNKSLLKGNIMSCIGVFLRRDIALKFPFHENRLLSGTEDWQLWLALAARFPIHHFPVLTSALIQHQNRSVMKFDEDSLVQRTEILLESLLGDHTFLKKFGMGAVKRIKAHMFSYIALHAALSGKSKKAIPYLGLAAKADLREVFTRRTLAVLKHLIVS